MLKQHEGDVFIKAKAIIEVLDKVIGRYKEAHSGVNEWEEEHAKFDAAVTALEQMKAWLIGQINSQKSA